MRIVSLDTVMIPDYRMRKLFAEQALSDLQDDIEAHGLYNPIVVAELDKDKYRLVQGERRFRALVELIRKGKTIKYGNKHCPLGHIPVTFLGELDDITLLEMELAENVLRQDLSFAEKADAIYKLNDLRKKQAAARGEKHSLTDTAKEILGEEKVARGIGTQEVRDMVLVGKHLSNEKVRKAANLKEALSIIRKENQAVLTEALTARVVIKETDHTPLFGDSFEVLKSLETGFFDCIITDPPYGIDADEMKPQSGSNAATEHLYKDDFTYATACVSTLANEGFRITRNSAHCYMFCDIAYWHIWRDIFITAGWYVWPKPIIWSKGSVGNLLGTANGPRSTYEPILYAIKGGRPVSKVYADVTYHTPPKADLHAAQKPVSLYTQLLRASCVPGDRVIDPFMGCGTIFPAANALSLLAHGIERLRPHYNQAILRLNERPEFLDE